MAKKPRCANCIHGDKYDRYCRLNACSWDNVYVCTQFKESTAPEVNKCSKCKHCTARGRCTVGIMNCRAMFEPKELKVNGKRK